MAKIHVLTANTNGTYRVVLHSPTPVGNNSANVSWADCLTGAGLNVTVLPPGNGPGEISNAEATTVTNGTVLETVTTLMPSVDPNQAELDELADIAIAEAEGRLALTLKYFGHEQG